MELEMSYNENYSPRAEWSDGQALLIGTMEGDKLWVQIVSIDTMYKAELIDQLYSKNRSTT